MRSPEHRPHARLLPPTPRYRPLARLPTPHPSPGLLSTYPWPAHNRISQAPPSLLWLTQPPVQAHTSPSVLPTARPPPPRLALALILQVAENPFLLLSRAVHEVIPDLEEGQARPRLMSPRLSI